jgi:hypothetical protein
MGAVGIFKPARPAGTGESETGENWGESHWRLHKIQGVTDFSRQDAQRRLLKHFYYTPSDTTPTAR